MNNNTVLISLDDFAEILTYAVRYALGRKTYAVDDVCTLVDNNVSRLSTTTLTVMKRDISEASDYGMSMDECRWKKTLTTITTELDRRAT